MHWNTSSRRIEGEPGRRSTDVDEFKTTMDTFERTKPLHEVGDAKLTYVGTSSFGQKRQVSVPLVVNDLQGRCVPDAVRRAGRLRPNDGSESLQGPGALPVRALPVPRIAKDPPSMEQILANGLYLGAQYALIALGPDPDLLADERVELCPRADVRLRRLRDVYGRGTAWVCRSSWGFWSPRPWCWR